MLIAFLIASILFGMWITYMWSSSGALNSMIKVLLSIYTLWAVTMLLAQVWPMINNGTVRLI
jgi:hypothetical protein